MTSEEGGHWQSQKVRGVQNTLFEGVGPNGRGSRVGLQRRALDLRPSARLPRPCPVSTSEPGVELGLFRGGHGFLLSLGLLPG